MGSRLEDFEVIKRASKKMQKGTYRNFTREELAKEGITPLDGKGRLLRCEEERSFCFYDSHLLDYEVEGQIITLKRCHQCGTIYYSSSGEKKPSG